MVKHGKYCLLVLISFKAGESRRLTLTLLSFPSSDFSGLSTFWEFETSPFAAVADTCLLSSQQWFLFFFPPDSLNILVQLQFQDLAETILSLLAIQSPQHRIGSEMGTWTNKNHDNRMRLISGQGIVSFSGAVFGWISLVLDGVLWKCETLSCYSCSQPAGVSLELPGDRPDMGRYGRETRKPRATGDILALLNEVYLGL